MLRILYERQGIKRARAWPMRRVKALRRLTDILGESSAMFQFERTVTREKMFYKKVLGHDRLASGGYNRFFSVEI